MGLENLRNRLGIHACGSGILEQQKCAKGFGTSVYQIFIGSPQRYQIKKESDNDIQTFKLRKSEANEQVICHANFLLNLADDPATPNWSNSMNSIRQLSKACIACDIDRIVVHSGSPKERTVEEGMKSWNRALRMLDVEFPTVQYLIENNAYKKNPFHKLNLLYEIAQDNHNASMCVDTAHMWSAGYNFDLHVMEDLATFMPYIKLIHFNNHPGPCGANIDRHSNTALPDGQIPMNALKYILRGFECPMIMEIDLDGDKIERSYEALT